MDISFALTSSRFWESDQNPQHFILLHFHSFRSNNLEKFLLLRERTVSEEGKVSKAYNSIGMFFPILNKYKLGTIALAML